MVQSGSIAVKSASEAMAVVGSSLRGRPRETTLRPSPKKDAALYAIRMQQMICSLLDVWFPSLSSRFPFLESSPTTGSTVKLTLIKMNGIVVFSPLSDPCL